MRGLDRTNPKQFIADFFTYFMTDLVCGSEDVALIVDRYHTPDIVQIADGTRMDRTKLIAHARPAHKHQPSARWEVHEAIADGDRIAARYTLHFQSRKREGRMEVHFFGQFADDGRMRQAHMLTRFVPVKAEDIAEAGAGTQVSSGQPATETSHRRQISS
ncbi:nuclear transport factor 2 family protein [Sphaerisporangium sp. NPDC005289]|uniref:nuclear transport factor 2 family protein n=1 Tax=Sphaerisporangium sp. NPDC005289 TaxID=3155247 RepID=UPI0033BB3DD1